MLQMRNFISHLILMVFFFHLIHLIESFQQQTNRFSLSLTVFAIKMLKWSNSVISLYLVGYGKLYYSLNFVGIILIGFIHKLLNRFLLSQTFLEEIWVKVSRRCILADLQNFQFLYYFSQILICWDL